MTAKTLNQSIINNSVNGVVIIKMIQLIVSIIFSMLQKKIRKMKINNLAASSEVSRELLLFAASSGELTPKRD
jgi:hypothetical protein